MKSYFLLSLLVVACSCLIVVESGKIPDEFKAEQLNSGPCIGRGQRCMTAPHGCCSGLECDARDWTCNSSWSLTSPSWTYLGVLVLSVLANLFQQRYQLSEN